MVTNRSFSPSLKDILNPPNPALGWGLAVAVGVLGMPGLTAYVGLLDIAPARRGDPAANLNEG